MTSPVVKAEDIFSKADTMKRREILDPKRSTPHGAYHDESPPSNEIIALLANNISQSLEYCYRTTNGTHGPQLASFPLWIAYDFYKSQPERNMELAWISELGNSTAPDSRFDLYCVKFNRDPIILS